MELQLVYGNGPVSTVSVCQWKVVKLNNFVINYRP